MTMTCWSCDTEIEKYLFHCLFSTECFYWQWSIFTMWRGISDEDRLQIKFIFRDLPQSLLNSGGETVVFSYYSLLHLAFFTLTTLEAWPNTSTVKGSKLMKARWRLGCYMRCPKGNWQIKWFVMLEETDNALREKLNHEENWNNSGERLGLLLTTHVCCSQFIYSPPEWGRFRICYWSRISS